MKKLPPIAVLLLLLAALPASAADVLARRITLFFEKKPLKSALDEVARQASFEWSYNPGIIDEGRPVSLAAPGWTVREALVDLLGDGYELKTSGNFLILKKRKPPRHELSGTLRDPKTGERVANATVFDRRTMRSAVTDSGGYYSLKVRGRAELAVAKIGFRDTLLQVTPETPRFLKIEIAELPPPDTTAAPGKNWRGALQKSATELEMFFSATLDRWHDANVADTFHRRAQVSFLPKMGTNRSLDGKVTNDFSLNILAGQSAGVSGVEVAALGNFTKKDVRGGQFAGLFNFVKGGTSGIAAAAVFNHTGGELGGAQLAGLVNTAGGGAPELGIQAAGLLNWSAPEKVFSGAQAAGLLNIAGEVRGVQVGPANFAKEVRGVQIGIFNSAKRVRGLQIGLVNRSGGRVLPGVNW